MTATFPTDPPAVAARPSSSEPEPRLAPPGAGLPLPELLVARARFRLRRILGTRDRFDADMRAERAAIAALVAATSPADAGRRVLIARPRGLEDSSRFWSVWMTLDHLRIVNEAIAGVIRLLAAGRTPDRAASTAAVKPSLDADAGVLAVYERSCDAVLAAAASVTDLRTAARHPHPWFGPLDAHSWHALAGMHMRIHRVQLERIRAGLADAARASR